MTSSFDPHSISQDDLHRYREAAEQAWSDETRHPNMQGHPEKSAGQCYVTSRWLTQHLGGTVGLKQGHYFWVSPDRKYVIDLTGDQFHYSPEDLRYRGIRLDDEDPGWEPTPEQASWRPGPIMYKSATHPLFKGFRVKEFKTEAPRVKLFAQRANAALEGNADS
jgi:hypothetical protein